MAHYDPISDTGCVQLVSWSIFIVRMPAVKINFKLLIVRQTYW